MNGNGVSRVHGHSLNGAGEFYYEAVEGSQNPGGLLLSPAAYINPAQYASVLEGRFKQLQGELHGQRGAERGPGGVGEEPKPRTQSGTLAVTQAFGRQCARGIITSGQKIHGC